MMKIIDSPQRSPEWMRLHLGRPTASGFGELMTPKLEPRTGEMPKTYLYKRLAEKIKGQPLPAFSTYATEQGTMLEDEAFHYFAVLYDLEPRQVGFILADDGRCGCSPDALLSDDSGLEIKCPNAETHLRYLDGGVLPDQYAPQVHGSLYVSGRKNWNFMSYHRGLPDFRVIVQRDEENMQKIGKCLAKFYTDFDSALARITGDHSEILRKAIDHETQKRAA
jgi:hypothetical protein